MPFEIKTFAEHPDMWFGFAGCESWGTEDQPIFTEVEDKYLVVADANGIGVYGNEDAGVVGIWFLRISFPNSSCARVFLNGIERGFEPTSLGFEEI